MFSKWILPVWRTFTGYFSRRQFYEPGGYAEIWHIAWPLIILSASNTVMMITNRVFLAWDSKDEVAASMPASQMFFTLMAFFLITTGFTATIVAQYHGANDRIGCVRAAWNGFYFGTAVAALLVVLLPLGPGQVHKPPGQPQQGDELGDLAGDEKEHRNAQPVPPVSIPTRGTLGVGIVAVSPFRVIVIRSLHGAKFLSLRAFGAARSLLPHIIYVFSPGVNSDPNMMTVCKSF